MTPPKPRATTKRKALSTSVSPELQALYDQRNTLESEREVVMQNLLEVNEQIAVKEAEMEPEPAGGPPHVIGEQ